MSHALAPTSYLSPAPLSSSGRPILLDNEVELKVEAGVGVFRQDGKKIIETTFESSRVTLTNSRIIFIVESSSSSTSTSSASNNIHGNRNASSTSSIGSSVMLGWVISLGQIKSIEDCSSFLHSSRRIHLRIATLPPPVPPPSSMATISPSSSPLFYLLYLLHLPLPLM